ncbi:UDP-glycosyltransferase 79B30-like [Senna tora]|uniref:UDP-glycosyltransferase 79B30-like n=1 Tax=Senna tora TaxID=362788 RepID=A0A834XAP9_9FABA|nr:UDP-glycosyltransferase 79B30-like [Senna tora]
MDRTAEEIESLLFRLRPDFVFFDFAYWIPNLARKLGIKSIPYWVISVVACAYGESKKVQACVEGSGHNRPSFPDASIELHHGHEEEMFSKMMKMEFGSGICFYDRIDYGYGSADAIGYKSCREIEGSFVDYLESVLKKPILLSGPIISEPSTSTLEEKWAHWLARFKAGSVIYCAFGSEWILSHHKFQELLLGLEKSGMPFFTALKPPNGFESVEAAMPEGFAERVKERGIVYGGWVQQQLILGHPSLGCFITHCNFTHLRV